MRTRRPRAIDLRCACVTACHMATDFLSELQVQRSYLLRVARLQLRDQALAEDVVQDTLAAALAAQATFAGNSSVKTWLTGILKHKIVDAIRRKQREPIAVGMLGDDVELEDLDGLFKDNGGWSARPADWGDPEQALDRKEFFGVLEGCMENLPPKTARVFMLREVMDMDSEAICKELSITANNLWVILYRARMALRECLELNWFDGKAR
jgi:RNA polymerase sigma-70 factor, ECF subfamily